MSDDWYLIITSHGFTHIKAADDEEAAWAALDISQAQSSFLIDIIPYEKQVFSA